MADKTTTTSSLTMVANFYDGDTRTINQNNPKPIEQLPALINAFANYVKTNNVIIGDLAGAAFKEITQAKVINKTVIDLDLG